MSDPSNSELQVTTHNCQFNYTKVLKTTASPPKPAVNKFQMELGIIPEGILTLHCWGSLPKWLQSRLTLHSTLKKKKKTFIQHHDQTITFSNQQHGCTKKKTTTTKKHPN